MFLAKQLRRLILSLCLIAACGFLGAPLHADTGAAPVVHLIAIGDTDNGGAFGRKVGEDAENTVRTFEQAFAKAGRAGQLKTYLMLGAQVTPKNVLDKVASLNVRPIDTIVVLYSGHGAADRQQGHVLTFKHGRLLRKDLLAAMRAKNPRLMVALTDCCSAGVPERPVVPTYQPRNLAAGQTMPWSTVESLFLRHQGLVDITAAEPGYCGKLDLQKPGSLFTNALTRILKAPHADLIRNLDKDGDGHMQWDEILPQLRGLAARYDAQQTNDPDVRPQQAYATSLGRWMPLTQNAARR